MSVGLVHILVLLLSLSMSQNTRSHLHTLLPEPQMAPGHRPSLSFPNHPSSSAQLAPLHTPYDSFPGNYVMSSSAPPFQNHPPAYFAYHPVESSPYPPTQYYPFPSHPPFSYLRHEARAQGPSYPQMQPPPVPAMPQSMAGIPGPSYTGSLTLGSIQQFPPAPYSSPDQSGLAQPYQRNTRQWTYGHPGPLSDASPQHHHYSNPLPQNDSVSTHTTDSDRLPSSGAGPHSTVSAILPSVTDTSSEKASEHASQTVEPSELNHKSNNPSRGHKRPHVRRHYHPNPPTNRSEWVMWVGNVPGDASQDELWRFLKSPSSLPSGSEETHGAEDGGILSLFLISRSNCAFVNYNTKENLDLAITQFNGRKLRPDDRLSPKLVCRARRKGDDLRAGVGAQRGINIHTRHVKKSTSRAEEAGSLNVDGDLSQTPASENEEALLSSTERISPKAPIQSPSSYASTTSSFLLRHFPRRFFILKSLTQYDLDLSVQRGMWATQKHNEGVLDKAFRTSKEVTLIFSVNKSGEFYGFARMASAILQSSPNISWAPRADQLSSFTPSSEETKEYPTKAADGTQTQSAREQQSASHVLSFTSETAFVPDVAGRSTASDKGWPVASQSPQDSGSLFHQRPGGRSRGSGLDESGGSGSRLRPVIEEVHGGEVEEDRPVSVGVRSEIVADRLEDQRGEGGWGQPFKIEWLRTERVSFYRTRHLRNPWNHHREIKIARDGTEVEPTVGQRLIEEWSSLARAAGKRAQAGSSGESRTVHKR